MFGVAERANYNGTRASYIQTIGSREDGVVRRQDRSFQEQLQKNLTALNDLTENVTVGIAAIHRDPNAMWQRHGIATCSAALNSGFAFGAARFYTLPSGPDVSTLASKEVPIDHLTLSDLRNRTAHTWTPSDHLRCEIGEFLVRLFIS